MSDPSTYKPFEWDDEGKPTAWICPRCPVVVFSPTAAHDCEAINASLETVNLDQD